VFCFLFSTRAESTGRVLVLGFDNLEVEEEVPDDQESRFSGLADEESELGNFSVNGQLRSIVRVKSNVP
jgi:hypothetical protein